MESVIVYQGRANDFVVELLKNSTTLTQQEMEAITKFEIKVNGSYYNSGAHSAGFVRSNSTGEVTIKPSALGLTAGKDTVEFIIYDEGDNVLGRVWAQFVLLISDEAIPAQAG